MKQKKVIAKEKDASKDVSAVQLGQETQSSRDFLNLENVIIGCKMNNAKNKNSVSS